MSDSKVNNLIKSQDVIQSPNRVKELDEYNSGKCLTPSTELLIEFLSAIMTKDYRLALEYCTEILDREPNNLTALEFYPLILEKLEMIEDLESTSSESSTSSSSSESSSGSEKKLYENDFIDKTSLYEWGKSYTSCTEPTSPEKIAESTVSNPTILDEETTNENSKTMRSNITLQAKSKKTLLPKVELNKKNNEMPLSSNLLIHPTQTITLIRGNDSSTSTKTHVRSMEETRILNVSQQEPPKKILLHMSRTVTFPKRLSPPNSERAGDPQ